jgi:hypothetical protein
MNVEMAEYLLGLDKYIVNNGEIAYTFVLDIQYPIDFRLTLCASDDLDQSLLVNIKESEDRKSTRLNSSHAD